MNAPFKTSRFSRRTILKGGALTVGFALGGLPAKASAQFLGMTRVLDPKEVDAFLAVNADGTVTVFSGKVDLGQGLRISFRQIVAEELGVGIDKINLIEGDTALTPDQGRTSGSNGIQRGGMQMRQAAATARNASAAWQRLVAGRVSGAAHHAERLHDARGDRHVRGGDRGSAEEHAVDRRLT